MFRKKLYFAILFASFLSVLSAQNDRDSIMSQYIFQRPDTAIINGEIGDAILVSMLPDAEFVGVFISIDKDYPYSVDELTLPIKSYFDHYGVPAFFVKQTEPYEGKSARIGVFADGKVVIGDLPSGNFSLTELQNHPESVFTVIKASHHLAKRGKY